MMTTIIEKRLIEWLRDAHAMEKQAEQIYRLQAGHIGDYPDIKAKYEQQAQLAKEHAVLLEQCLNLRGSDTSTVKSMGAKLLGAFQSASGHFVGDEIVKSLLVIYTFTHMKIAGYRILVAATEIVGDSQTCDACDRILFHEMNMLAWLDELLEPTTLQYLMREEKAEETAAQ